MSYKTQIENKDFFSRVYDVTLLIPYGRITSYGAIARFLGSGRSARMVGWALNASHSEPEFIPAHRVVNRNGMLTGKHHFGNSTTMQQLLENEGIIIEEDRIVNFAEKFWDPLKELS
ncbi:MAG: MGMT family protein [Bacteroidales bacterium]|jgi:methylated-DNA-protein-cysteine methyltransferase-like protein|nr:MGMT family protein [Bacteroidales bacterium]